MSSDGTQLTRFSGVECHPGSVALAGLPSSVSGTDAARATVLYLPNTAANFTTNERKTDRYANHKRAVMRLCFRRLLAPCRRLFEDGVIAKINNTNYK